MNSATRLLSLLCEEDITLECRPDRSITATYPDDAKTSLDRVEILVRALRDFAADPDCEISVSVSAGYLEVGLPAPAQEEEPKEAKWEYIGCDCRLSPCKDLHDGQCVLGNHPCPGRIDNTCPLRPDGAPIFEMRPLFRRVGGESDE